MKAVVLNGFGDSSVLHIENRPRPRPKDNEVLLQVYASGLNRADIAQRKGNYPAPKDCVQDVLGLEVSGKIVETGTAVKNWSVGQEVCALLPGGGYAEYVAVDEGSCLPIPSNFNSLDAASLPEALFTVWHNLFQRGNLQKNDHLLIYGGSGGIGSMAIQLSRLYGAHPIALASSPEKIAFCRKLGAEKVINYTKEALTDSLERNSVDVILDSVGGDYLKDNMHLLRPEGKLVYINAMEGGLPSLNIFKLMQKRLWLTGSTLRSRNRDFKKELATEILEKAFPILENPNFQNMTTHRFSIAEVKAAHQLMDSRDFYGKILLYF